MLTRPLTRGEAAIYDAAMEDLLASERLWCYSLVERAERAEAVAVQLSQQTEQLRQDLVWASQQKGRTWLDIAHKAGMAALGAAALLAAVGEMRGWW